MFGRKVSILFTLLFIFSISTYAQISVEPLGFGISTEGDDLEIELELTNSGEDDVEFRISYGLVREEEENRGPGRDDFGDVVNEINIGGGNWYGVCWDGDLLWCVNHGDRRMISMNMDGEVQNQVELPQGDFNMPLGMCHDGEAFWIGSWGDGPIHRVDEEGNIIATLNADWAGGPTGVAWDGENLWYVAYQGGNGGSGILQVTPDGELLRTIDLQALQNRDWISIEYVPEHRGGELWVLHNRASLYQLNIDNDQAEIVQELGLQNNNSFGLGHDGENLWYINDASLISIDDGTAELVLLEIEPSEGVVAADDVEGILVTVTPDGYDAGVYNMVLQFELTQAGEMRDDFEDQIIEISAVVSVDAPAASVFCSVIDAATEEPIPNVNVDLQQYLMERTTNNNGLCAFENIPPAEYDFTFSVADYLPLVEPYRIDGEGELELNVELLHASCILDREEIVAELPGGEQTLVLVEISNEGNGPLTYTTEKKLLGDANADPWALRSSLPAGVITDEARIQGIAFVNDLFYLAGANNQDPVIYIVNRDEDLIGQFPQHGESRYGYKDLTWDGELIWGSGERVVYGFAPDGELVTSFDSGISPCTNMTWDNERDILWVSGTTTNIIGFDRDGNQVAELDRQNRRIYGISFWQDDPGGHQLYIYHKINDVGNFLVAKGNIENGEVVEVVSLEPEEGGAAQSCFITNQYDIYSWVFMACANSGAEDRIDIWQIDARKDWMEIDPAEGIVEAESQQEFEITLDATGLPEAMFEGEIVFTHDGIGGEIHLPISLQVGEGGGPEEMVLELDNGWNMVSVYVQPDPDDVRDITSDIVEAGTLIMMKNTVGQFYNPQFNFNNIPGWNFAEGYMIKMDDADELAISGMAVAPNDAIALRAGWQIVSYFPRDPIDAIVALSGLGENLVMAKDGAGRFYNPAFNFSNMGDMVPGQGYLVKVNEIGELIYNLENELAFSPSTEFSEPNLIPIHPPTNENMSLLVLTDIPEGEIGVYANGNLVGSGVIQDFKCGIAIWGDDPTTKNIDGAIKGDQLEFSIMGAEEKYEFQIELIEGSGQYSPNDFQAIRISQIKVSPDEFGLVSIFPNPFNNHSTITYNLLENSEIELSIFDLTGRRVIDLASGQKPIGKYSTTIGASNLSSGVYIVHLRSNTGTSKRKLTLVK